MGGLIARYALAGVAGSQPGFPPRLLVEDAVTLGTPHAGTGWAYGCAFAQCHEMRPGSPLMDWLAANARNPQGSGGTDWTAIASEDDGIVSAGSAIAMPAPHRATYRWYMGVDHPDYMLDTSGALDADIRRQDWDGGWLSVWDAPHAVRFADYAFLSAGW
jgi:hypothetical protein